MSDKILWSPSAEDITKTHMTKFTEFVSQQENCSFKDYFDLHHYSIHQTESFWENVWDYCGLTGRKGDKPYLAPHKDMKKTRFFPEAQLNYAEALIAGNTQETPLVFYGENQVKKSYSKSQMIAEISALQAYFKAKGIVKGDRIAAILPNCPEAIIAMLAAASIGAIWSSCSPDFGEEAILDRFEQINPKILISTDYYLYNDKKHSCADKNKAIIDKLTSCNDLITISYDGTQSCSYNHIIENHKNHELSFEPLPFHHPLFILYSSGTTGKPKSITHSVGGTILQHVKEHQLHCNMQAGDKVFYFTTCGWMMWNWLVSALASDVQLILYDGSPFYPSGERLFEIAAAEKMTFFGTAAKFIDALEKQNIHPKDKFALSHLRTIASTGSPLMPQSFQFVYDHIHSNIHLASISGGTDIISCFVLGNPNLPVYKGQIQVPGLGMNVQVYNEEGSKVSNEKGELVCCQAFPSMPIGFWGDDEQQSKYHNAYFAHFDHIWYHGDYIKETEEKGYIIYGRSDATLNPGGVRIGTAEIYRQVEKNHDIVESLVIGHNDHGDEKIILFLKLQNHIELTDQLVSDIKQNIRTNTSPRHVPYAIYQVADIPKTKSGKVTELTIKKIMQGEEIKNLSALANPECLDEYYALKKQL